MSFPQPVLRASVFLAAVLFPVLAPAADLSTLQTALSLARDDMEKEKARHDADLQAITQQQKMVATRKKELAEETAKLEKMQKDSRQGEARYREAERRYQKTQANLDAAWKK